MPVFNVAQPKPSMDARVWLDELPVQYEVEPDDAYHERHAQVDCVWHAQQAAVALRYVNGIPRFGLLGGTFEPSATGTFVVRLPRRHPLDDVRLLTAPPRRAGLPIEYHDAVVRGLMGRPGEELAIPCGVLTLRVAAHDESGSSQVVFLRVARALHQVLSLRPSQGVEGLNALEF